MSVARAYYNEHEPYAAQWLRNLITAGHIMAGDVDERDIQDVQPDDLRGYTRCHFFAGIAGWDLALRFACWPDDRPIWTGSCPCQPFSSAGKGAGFDDPRHLWPAWLRLIRECRPAIVFGEQVPSAGGLGWLDTVATELEALAYAVGAVDLPAAGVGAPHIRQRLWFVAHAERGASERRRHDVAGETGGTQGKARQRQRIRDDAGDGGQSSHLEDAERQRSEDSSDELGSGRAPAGHWSSGDARGTGAWGDVQWIDCRDGKRRPVEPGTQQMVDGLSVAVGLLRAVDFKEEIDAATSQGLGDEIVSAVRAGVRPEAIWLAIGGRLGVPAAFLLLASVCEHQGQLGRVFYGATSPSAEISEDSVRAVRQVGAPARASQGWRLPEQLARELGNLVPRLSQAGASLAGCNGHPLAHGVPGRVGRLRAYGNSIVPQVAAEFIGAYLDLTRTA